MRKTMTERLEELQQENQDIVSSEFEYMIIYTYSTIKIGRYNIIMDKKISSYDDILELDQIIKKETKHKDAFIVHYQLLNSL